MIMADQLISTVPLGPDRRKQCGWIDLKAISGILCDIVRRNRAQNTRFVAEKQATGLDFGGFRTMRENLALYGP